jgi:hypothetical protein
LVICARLDCRRVFFLCRHCDRGDRYCSAACTQRARHTTLHAAGHRYQQTRRGRLHHAARQARYRARRKKVTHQTSPTVSPSGIVPSPLGAPTSGPEAPDADVACLATRPRCARCGRRGRFVRHTTLVHVRPRPIRRR